MATRPDRPSAVGLVPFSFSGGGVTACVSTRFGGVSTEPYDWCNLSFGTGDDHAAVLENRTRLCAALGFTIDDLVLANQVHGDTVVVAGRADRGRGARGADHTIGDADALVTDTPGVLLAVLVADCVPVVLFDPVRAVVAVAHAGWRGTVAHVTANTVRTMVERFGSDPATLRAGIGPSIGPASYEVGPEVVDAARAAFPDAPDVIGHHHGRTTFDLWAANAHDLHRSGVPATRVECLAIDTFVTTDRFYSHRAGAPTGRFAAFVALHAARHAP
jgi:YfiH family protein